MFQFEIDFDAISFFFGEQNLKIDVHQLTPPLEHENLLKKRRKISVKIKICGGKFARNVERHSVVQKEKFSIASAN